MAGLMLAEDQHCKISNTNFLLMVIGNAATIREMQ